MMRDLPRRSAWVVGIVLGLATTALGQETRPTTRPHTKVLPTGADFFPLAVWLQSPSNAARYAAAGINIHVGLWNGPTAAHLATLKSAGMKTICDQNAVGLAHVDDPTILAWMHGDEPDNAQALPNDEGWGPPIPPERVVADYRRIRAADPTRPVLLNLGQGVAWDGWYGRGVRTNKPEDYPEYLKGCDIGSFDIYPAVHDRPEVAGRLELVAFGVDRMRAWTADEKTVWNCIETTRISNPERKPTPHQVRAEVWMSLIHGSRGIIYFAHHFVPEFVEAALLADADMLAAVTRLNHTIRDLASLLNSPTVIGGVSVTSSATDVPVDVMVKKARGATWVFAAAMRPRATTATFRVADLAAGAAAHVIDETRTIRIDDGHFTDTFGPYDVHLYEIR